MRYDDNGLIFFCYSERLFRTMTDLVVSEGYAAAGYEYINVDDCWMEKSRGSRGELIADKIRFPSGMRDLSEYVRNILNNKLLHVLYYILIQQPMG